MSLLDRLQTSIVLADGAMGTLLYSYGIDYCYEELNVERPHIIEKIHQDYVRAGATLIQTNTYSANAIKLARYGLEHRVKELNEAAIHIAKRATNDDQYIVGTIGGIRGIRKSDTPLSDVLLAVKQQAEILLAGNLDGLLLETYYDFDELCAVIHTLRPLTDVPIIAQVSMDEPGILQNGLLLNKALQHLEDIGANVVGVNCRLGPFHTIQSFENVALPQHAFLSAAPNASLLDIEDGRMVYESEADYFGRAAVQLRKEGVRLIGGCCGTTPQHIAAAKKHLENLAPITTKHVRPQKPMIIQEASPIKLQPLHEKAQKERTIIVELDTPRHLETTEYIKAAHQLAATGIDAITLADNSLASPRLSNMAMGAILKKEHHIRPLVHITCRDHNLIGLQSHLMGLDALEIHDILAVTGDPTKVGDFPGATSVYDVSSMELLQLIQQFNQGISFSGKSLKKKANFSVAAAFNPNVRVLDRAVQRLEKKIACGADYFISQPVYSTEKIIAIHEATKHIDTPIFIGIMPLTNIRNAEFLHHEVPGIKLSDDVLERMRACGEDRQKATAEGVQIAKELIATAADLFHGIYLITPFLRYEMIVELIHYIQELDATKERKSIYVETSN